MKRLLERAFRLFMITLGEMADSPRRKAAKSIARVEKNGGYVLKCGCLIFVRPNDLRLIIETAGPEAVLEVESEIKRIHEHPHYTKPPKSGTT